MKTECMCVVLVLCAAFAVAQDNPETVPVVALSSSDAAMVQRVHQEMIDAEQHWKTLQQQIVERYLVVDKADADASDAKWYPKDAQFNGFGLASGTILITSGSAGWNSAAVVDECSPQIKAERERYKKEQELAESAREAQSRRIRKGWEVQSCVGCDPVAFDYGQSYRYLIRRPAKRDPSPSFSSWGSIAPTINTLPLVRAD